MGNIFILSRTIMLYLDETSIISRHDFLNNSNLSIVCVKFQMWNQLLSSLQRFPANIWYFHAIKQLLTPSEIIPVHSRATVRWKLRVKNAKTLLDLNGLHQKNLISLSI